MYASDSDEDELSSSKQSSHLPNAATEPTNKENKNVKSDDTVEKSTENTKFVSVLTPEPMKETYEKRSESERDERFGAENILDQAKKPTIIIKEDGSRFKMHRDEEKPKSIGKVVIERDFPQQAESHLPPTTLIFERDIRKIQQQPSKAKPSSPPSNKDQPPPIPQLREHTFKTPSISASELKVPKKVTPKLTGMHTSMECHLFPRLSESNMQFHDIYWNAMENGSVVLRKRNVKICKILFGFMVRFEEQNVTQSSIPNIGKFFCDAYLVDERAAVNQQIVSNIYSFEIPIQIGRHSKLEGKNAVKILLRSNYSQKEVVFRLVLRQMDKNNSTTNEVGTIKLPLIDAQCTPILKNEPISVVFGGNIRLSAQVSDVPKKEKPIIDSLPDVMIVDTRKVKIIALYRQLLCEHIASNDQMPLFFEPMLFNFPKIMEEKSILDLFQNILIKEGALNEDGNDVEKVKIFRKIYNESILPLVYMLDTTSRDRHIEMAKTGKVEKSGRNIYEGERCHPLTITEFTMIHSID